MPRFSIAALRMHLPVSQCEQPRNVRLTGPKH